MEAKRGECKLCTNKRQRARADESLARNFLSKAKGVPTITAYGCRLTTTCCVWCQLAIYDWFNWRWLRHSLQLSRLVDRSLSSREEFAADDVDDRLRFHLNGLGIRIHSIGTLKWAIFAFVVNLFFRPSIRDQWHNHPSSAIILAICLRGRRASDGVLRVRAKSKQIINSDNEFIEQLMRVDASEFHSTSALHQFRY